MSLSIQKIKSLIRNLLRKVLRNALLRLGYADDIKKRKIGISESLCIQFDFTVRYGPFKGLRIPQKLVWGNGTSRGAKLLGLYEKELLDYIFSIPEEYRYLIDLGAADGYYATGMLNSGRIDQAFCFEISQYAKDIIIENARLNGVEDRLEVYGDAFGFSDKVPQRVYENAIVICDIEGAEFDLLDRRVLEKLSKCFVIIEMHEFIVNGVDKSNDLRERASELFKVREVKQGVRDPSQFGELQNWSDDDRWLVCSEGRPIVMKWLFLEPI